ncbi:hypothetical protein [Flavobacterium capsici]|uniref:DUF4377 domain-containing protein n=1 Tax=Flavobacterium capsici TaxID=3075618 RepID=A0AA96F3E5_9FLAO|nr:MULTISPECIES: hypothetical protein [unclassified Flavobacterium]WNM18247.1 hypothetical protein RN608_09490 [Flavobacterium sp. PMR2A8]WNM22298.1 hypothetical protein RN605_02790 [Flavobacterium sp. PMTSA4]
MKRKKVVYIFCCLLIIFSSLTVLGQKSKCTDFKNGTFEYLVSDKSLPKAVSTRTDSIQIDSYSDKKIEFKSKINWLTECRYELECISVNKPSENSQIGEKVIVQIDKIEGKKAFCHYEYDDGTIREFIII